MKEIAVVGQLCEDFGDVLGKLLAKGLSVNAIVDNKEHLMIENTALTITELKLENRETLRDQLEGYHDVVMVFDDDLSNAEHNDFALNRFAEMARAAHEAGVARLLVVGSSESTAFFSGYLRRRNDIDWVYISTENDYPERVAEEIISPTLHYEVYKEN